MKRLNVLLISNLFPTPADPIRGIFTYQLAKRLKDLCDVTVVCPLPWFPRWANFAFLKRWDEFSCIPDSYQWQDFTVYSPKYLIFPKISEVVHASLMLQPLYKTVKRLHNFQKFDIVNTWWLYPDAVAAAWVADRLRLPHLVTALGCDINLFMQQRHKRYQIQWALQKADGVTVVSDALRQYLLRQGYRDKAIGVIYNGVDADLFYLRDKFQSSRQLDLVHKGKVVVFVGQLLEVKGVIYLIEAVERLIAAGNDLIVYLIGEGSDRSLYEAEIVRRGLFKRIFLVGNRPHTEIAVWMGACDVFCLPSIREGFPNVILEALFSGRPVVASHVGGIPEMVNENNGFLVEARNPNALADALCKALAQDWDPQSILATVAHFSWERAAERYLLALENATKAFNQDKSLAR